jgi:hypothetical protein
MGITGDRIHPRQKIPGIEHPAPSAMTAPTTAGDDVAAAHLPRADLPIQPPATSTPAAKNAPPDDPPTKILAIDIGGTKVKMLVNGQPEPRKGWSGRRLTPAALLEQVDELAADWEYEAVSIGYPGLVGNAGPRCEPGNLGPGWVGFNFPAALGCPVRIVNDAAMQALGSYDGGRMLFLGLGSALIAEHVIVTLELGQLLAPDGRTLGETLGRGGLERLGKDAWRAAVKQQAAALQAALSADYVVLGGGNAKRIKEPLPGVRLGHNLTAFRGGYRLWNIEDVPTLSPETHPYHAPASPDWRML